ncbi:serine protein kinase PrkA [Desulfopila aestuarii]|uniref:Putative serine protein kinase, PrkA n=1 Tax=Desulfopila aestuarii DSM 18488 TaxID=1121416 RepID=A0A1M7Y688_9BACT|nr:serine protein kinase PrkA [Desulfopila aestuarii]SHO48120.1 putative serine protein kinase, PrkA [Desulfopila aestuarii DSM 18488]
MGEMSKALESLKKHQGSWERRPVISFADFLQEVITYPERNIRNVYQIYVDMINAFICEGVDEYINDAESINYLDYNCNRLFVEGSDRPFFADRLFANRLMRHVDSVTVGAQQNKIYIFEGPHGSGKSTFLNNLLRKFEEYTNTTEGARYEVVWKLKGENSHEDNSFTVPCPSHDHPLLIVPKDVRRHFFDDLFENDEFKWKLFTEKKYDWVFHDEPCTICTSIYQGLLRKYGNPEKIMEFVFARPYAIRRRLGEGISVFNPGDRPIRNNVIHNDVIQKNLDQLFAGSQQVTYLYSRYAKTNNGIYALMDIKSHNTERLMELHNIISDGVHKVEDLEERVNSLLFALMNPEDRKVLTDLQAFSDRIEYIKIPYVLDLKTEVEIYREIFGRHIDESFLPRVLHNFARVIIGTRLRTKSEAMLEWIGDPDKYEVFCDRNLQLLKMEIFTGHIPKWLESTDVEGFNAKRRKRIIAESEKDGWQGLSGRDSIRMFNEFYTSFARDDKLIDMSMLIRFFKKYCKEDKEILPMGFLDSLLRMYNYAVLQEVKEALYYYNEEQISRDVQNYMFAVNFDLGSKEKCTYTGEKIEINEDFFRRIETRLLRSEADAPAFRNNVQRAYTTGALTQDILRDGLDITETSLYTHLYERYVHNLKEKVLEPFLRNENFRMAIRDYDTEKFKTYDRKIREDINFMFENLERKYGYSRQGAKEICIYVIENNLAKAFSG